MVEFTDYQKFVKGVMSQPSQDNKALADRYFELVEKYPNINFPQLLTAGIGLPGEVGEVADLVKKIFFQGKEPTPDVIAKIAAEAGDICWYLASLTMALGLDFNTILEDNITKLESRYPGGKFDVQRSENRKN